MSEMNQIKQNMVAYIEKNLEGLEGATDKQCIIDNRLLFQGYLYAAWHNGVISGAEYHQYLERADACYDLKEHIKGSITRLAGELESKVRELIESEKL